MFAILSIHVRCTCIAMSLMTFSYKHSLGVFFSPKTLIISSKSYDSNTSDSMLMTDNHACSMRLQTRS